MVVVGPPRHRASPSSGIGAGLGLAAELTAELTEARKAKLGTVEHRASSIDLHMSLPLELKLQSSKLLAKPPPVDITEDEHAEYYQQQAQDKAKADAVQSLFCFGLQRKQKVSGFSQPVDDLVSDSKVVVQPGNKQTSSREVVNAPWSKTLRGSKPSKQSPSRPATVGSIGHASSAPEVKPRFMASGGNSFRTNHLGQRATGRPRKTVKYSRSLTVLYSHEQRQDAKQRRWILVREAEKVMHFSLGMLLEMYETFSELSRKDGCALLDARQFWEALRIHGTKDAVLVQRLFTEFLLDDGSKENLVDCREFVIAACAVIDAPLDAKLELLFKLFDLDSGAEISQQEFTQMCVRGSLQSTEHERALERAEQVWRDIIEHKEARLADKRKDEERKKAVAAAERKEEERNKEELRCRDLLSACRRLPAATVFFTWVLSAEPPPKPDQPMGPFVPFAQRMVQLHREETAALQTPAAPPSLGALPLPGELSPLDSHRYSQSSQSSRRSLPPLQKGTTVEALPKRRTPSPPPRPMTTAGTLPPPISLMTPPVSLSASALQQYKKKPSRLHVPTAQRAIDNRLEMVASLRAPLPLVQVETKAQAFERRAKSSHQASRRHNTKGDLEDSALRSQLRLRPPDPRDSPTGPSFL